MMGIPIVCLMGPTATGKTALAVELIQHFPFEIVSVDSVMIYRGMDIGSAKPDAETLKIAPHHLIDICDPKASYSAAEFCRDANVKIAEIFSRGKIPLLVGGTMMYFHSFQKGIATLPARDELLREQLDKEGESVGWDNMHQRLRALDPEAAEKIHPHDRQRIQRALEVCLATGEKFSALKNHLSPTDHQVLNIILAPVDRANLHEKIRLRFLAMLKMGLVDEVRYFYESGEFNLSMPSMRSLGYRQVWEHFENNSSFDDMCEKGIIATRQFAKRQLTWLRSWQDAMWFNSDEEKLHSYVTEYIRKTVHR